MTALEQAIAEIVGVLEALGIDYMLIGGIVNEQMACAESD